MEHLWQAKLTQETIHLLILLSSFLELCLDIALKDCLELVLKGADGGRDDMAQLFVEFRRGIERILDINQVDKVLRIWFLKFCGRDVSFVVDLFIFVNGLGQCFLSCGLLLVEVGLIGSTKSISEGLSLVELFNTDSQVSDGKVNSTTLCVCLLIIVITKLPVGLSTKVARVVRHNIRKLSTIIASQIIIYLVVLVRLFEVDGDLCGNLREYRSVHARTKAFLEEEVLCLRQAKITVHRKGLFVEVSGEVVRR